MGNLIDSSYQPAWWLRSPHLQTLWPTLFRKRLPLAVDWERMELSDGDFIDLAWYPRPQAPLVLLMHGLEGSLESHYATSLMQALHKAGFSVVFMHLRGRGREVNRLPRSYHSGASHDLAEVLQQLKQRGQMPAAAVGISLSGNLLLKYLGETGQDSGLQAAVAISIPFQLAHCARKLETGFSRVYGRYLLDLLKRSYQHKFTQMPSPLPLAPADVKRLKTLYQFDDHITGPLNGFESADDYYTRCSCTPYLPAIATPTLIIHAQDDPFMTRAIVPDAEGVGAAVTLEITRHGGHVGFITGSVPWKIDYWLDQRVPDYLRTQLAVTAPITPPHSNARSRLQPV